jgi:hypothetical protein
MKSIRVEGVMVPAIEKVGFKGRSLTVSLSDGRVLMVPLEWYPRLAMAGGKALRNFRISPAGYGVHWPDLDEDLSVVGFLYPQGLFQRAKKAA